MRKTEPISEAAPLLNKKAAAAILSVSQRTLDELRQKRSLPFVKIGGAVRFVPSDLQRFIHERRVA